MLAANSSLNWLEGGCESHPILPFAIADMRKKPLAPSASSHTSALVAWGTMNKNHKRHSELELGFQAWISCNIRFVMEGALSPDWATFGGISMKLTHLGTALDLSIDENATIAMAYDHNVRTFGKRWARTANDLRNWNYDFRHRLHSTYDS